MNSIWSPAGCSAQVKRHAVEPIGVRTRKTARQLDLIMGEDVDNITLSALEHRQAS